MFRNQEEFPSGKCMTGGTLPERLKLIWKTLNKSLERVFSKAIDFTAWSEVPGLYFSVNKAQQKAAFPFPQTT